MVKKEKYDQKLFLTHYLYNPLKYDMRFNDINLIAESYSYPKFYDFSFPKRNTIKVEG